MFCATIKIPAFTKGKAQLSGIDVEQTANVRIHVERVIGNICQKFLYSVLPNPLILSVLMMKKLSQLLIKLCMSRALVNTYV